MYVDTRFGDFPHYLPTKTRGKGDDLFTGWMLLSYHKKVVASSARDSFPASNVTDENNRTLWVARQNRPGEALTIDLGRIFEVKAVQVNYADYKSGLYGTDSTVYTQFSLSVSENGERWKLVADTRQPRRDRPNAYVELTRPQRARFVRYDHMRRQVLRGLRPLVACQVGWRADDRHVDVRVVDDPERTGDDDGDQHASRHR